MPIAVPVYLSKKARHEKIAGVLIGPMVEVFYNASIRASVGLIRV